MDGLDSATWQALGLVLTLVGLAVSALLWVRRGPASGLRGVAWSLLPLAAGLTGLLRLGWEITDAVARWAARLIFSPVVWVGVVVAGVSGLLFVASGLMRRRGVGTRRHGSAVSSRSSGAAAALPRRRSTPAAAAEAPRAGAGQGGRDPHDRSDPDGANGTNDTNDMDEIEEILRRHGIQ